MHGLRDLCVLPGRRSLGFCRDVRIEISKDDIGQRFAGFWRFIAKIRKSNDTNVLLGEIFIRRGELICSAGMTDPRLVISGIYEKPKTIIRASALGGHE